MTLQTPDSRLEVESTPHSPHETQTAPPAEPRATSFPERRRTARPRGPGGRGRAGSGERSRRRHRRNAQGVAGRGTASPRPRHRPATAVEQCARWFTGGGSRGFGAR